MAYTEIPPSGGGGTWSALATAGADTDNLTIPIDGSNGFHIQGIIHSAGSGDVNVLFRLNGAATPAVTVVRKAAAGLADNVTVVQDSTGAAFPPGDVLSIGQMGGNVNRLRLWFHLTIFAGGGLLREYACKTLSLDAALTAQGGNAFDIWGVTTIVAAISSVQIYTNTANKILAATNYTIKLGA